MDVISNPKFCWISVPFLLQRGWGSKAMDTAMLKHIFPRQFFLVLPWFLFWLSVLSYSWCHWFLSAVGAFIILLAVLCYFINKKLCCEERAELPCLEQWGQRKRCKEKSRAHEGLGECHSIYYTAFGVQSLLKEQTQAHLVFLRLFVWKTVGFWVITPQIWSWGYAVTTVFPLSLLSGVMPWKMQVNSGERSPLPALSVVGVFCLSSEEQNVSVSE